VLAQLDARVEAVAMKCNPQNVANLRAYAMKGRMPEGEGACAARREEPGRAGAGVARREGGGGGDGERGRERERKGERGIHRQTEKRQRERECERDRSSERERVRSTGGWE
jgi:hypothetical protein